MAKYLVTLTPTGRFFFGGDMTFTVGDKKEEENAERKTHNEKFSSYIIHSSKFPQQTSLLGMLRFLLLANDKTAFDKEKQKIINKQRAKELIGEKSFSVNLTEHTRNEFGNIQSIGSCFLYDANKGKGYFTAPADSSLQIEGEETIVTTATLNGTALRIPVILKDKEEYSSKMWLREEYISVENGQTEILKDDDIFKEDERIGIRKNAEGKTEEDAFYKQIGYKIIQPHLSFAFMAIMENIDLTAYNGQLVSLGADSSIFVFNAIPQEDNKTFKINLPEKVYPLTGDKKWIRVVLQSDTYLEQADLEKVEYAICSTKSFRFLSFTVDTENYNVMGHINERSKRYNLYKAGSVFFLDQSQTEAFKNKIAGKKEFAQIGYNQYY